MKNLFLILTFFVCSYNLWAQDRIFNYVYQSGILGRGDRELEIWTTYSAGRENFYHGLDTRAEFEIGLNRHLQTAFYLNYTSKATGQANDSVTLLEKENDFSFSNEWKVKLSDQAANVIGLALYGEITIGTTEFGIEAKVILDKQIGLVTQALNIVFEPEWEWKPQEGKIKTSAEYKFEFNYGIGVALGKGWSLGAEIRNPNVYYDDHWVNSALYAGPTVSYSMNAFWINLTFMPQIAGLRGITPGQGLNLDEFERYQGRLLFSYAF
ncbi:MAG: hypothetical protein WCJ26_06730 [bacterium]